MITVQPSDQVAQFCQGVITMSVTATGSPPFCYQWTFNGADVPGATTNTLSITNATPAQAGDYKVEVGGLVGATTSQVAHVTVNLTGSPDLALTPAAAARGFVLTSFATNFPPVTSGDYLGGPGPLAAAFLTNHHVLISHLSDGAIYDFPTDVDYQNAGAVSSNIVVGGLAGMAQIAQSNGGFRYYMCIQTGSVYEVNQQGVPVDLIATIDHATGLVAAPANVSRSSLVGHLLVSTAGGTQNKIWDVDPIAKTNGLFSLLPCDGMSFTPDGATLLVAADDFLIGLKVLDATTNFQYKVSQADGIIAAAGTLLGNAYVNCKDGTVHEVNLSSGLDTIIAQCGSRGDFLYANPFDGSVLIMQSDRVKRLRFPGAEFSGVPGLTINRAAGSFIICWPTSFPGFTLQSTTNLSPPAWTVVTNAVVPSAGGYCVTVPAAQRAFFRLTR